MQKRTPTECILNIVVFVIQFVFLLLHICCSIHSQVGSLNIDLSVFFSRDRDSSSSLLAEAQPHHVSAPHSLDLAEQVRCCHYIAAAT